MKFSVQKLVVLIVFLLVVVYCGNGCVGAYGGDGGVKLVVVVVMLHFGSVDGCGTRWRRYWCCWWGNCGGAFGGACGGRGEIVAALLGGSCGGDCDSTFGACWGVVWQVLMVLMVAENRSLLLPSVVLQDARNPPETSGHTKLCPPVICSPLAIVVLF